MIMGGKEVKCDKGTLELTFVTQLSCRHSIYSLVLVLDYALNFVFRCTKILR
jgi:hypothetical protein